MKQMARAISVAMLLAGSAPLAAQGAAVSAGVDVVDPDALAMLDRMAGSLRSLKQFRVRAEPARNAYVTFPATGTVGEIVLAADTQLGLRMPLPDLFM